jgi:NarL family two-component system response regulator LiaR
VVITFINKHRQVIVYGAALAVLLFVMKWLEWRFLILDHAFEIYAGLIALLFTGLGIWLALKLTTPKVTTVIVEKKVIINSPDFVFNTQELERVGISQRELGVLQLMADGLSNAQIAEKLFVSLNTVKTHSSKVFEKLEVQRRTQAVEKAKQIGLIPR